MRLISDYHTHSKYSRFFHGKNKILEMAISANAMGLSEIAITDHGFNHWFKTNKANLKRARAEINEINSWSKTKVLLGIEADIISESGKLDVDNETLAMLDVLVIGYHRMIKTDFAGYFGNAPKTKESIQKCTRAFINAINSYPVTIVSHLDSVLTTDLYEIGCACRDNNVLVEINNRHNKWTREQVDALVASGCLFVVSSDAHSRDQVGVVDNAFDVIKKFEIPTEYIVNVEFEQDEKTEEHKEADYYYSIYQQKQDEKQGKADALELKKKTEFTETLSDEMEKALSEIAAEKGFAYNKPNEQVVEEEEESDFLKSVNFIEDENLLERAQKHLENLERMEREAAASEAQKPEETFVQDPVSDALSNFGHKKPEPSQEVAQEPVPSVQEISIPELIEEPKPEPVQIVDTTRSNNLGSINSIMSELKAEKTKSAAKPEEKAEAPVQKAAPKRKSFGGFMGNGIVGTAEKNKSSKTSK